MLRQILVGLTVAMSTVVVAPATAQMMSSEELNAPLTRVQRLESGKPLAQPEPVSETMEQFPLVSNLEVPVSTSEPSRIIETVEPSQPLKTPLVVNTGESKENSHPSEVEVVEPVQPLEPTQVIPTQQQEPSRVVEQNVTGPKYRFDSSIKLEPFRVEPSQPVEPTRVVPVQPIQEPSPVVEQPPIAQNVVVPFNAKGRLVNQNTRVTARNNIVPFSSRQRVVNRVEPSQPVNREQSTRITPEVVNDFSLEHGKSGTPPLEPETVFSLDRDTKLTPGTTTTLEAPSLNRNVGTSYPNITQETDFSFGREFSTPVSTVRIPTQNVVVGNDANVRTVATSTRASDLGVVTVQPNLQPAVVETQQEVKPEPKPRPKGNLSVGVSGIGGREAVLETSAGIEYDGFSTTVSLNHPLNGTGQDTIGLATTLPFSDRASVTVKADQINIDPIISATVESKITEQLKVSASFNNINKETFNLELAANYAVNDRWSTNASFNVTTRQLNLGATYTGKGFDATVKVDDVARNPQLGAALGIELSSSTKLELSGSNLTTEPTFGVKAIFSF